jgi:hypothetical protein
MNNKGDLSITTIVVAAIALLVLVVLVAVFTGQIGGFTLGVQDCASKGGVCYASCADADAVSSGHTELLPGKTSCSKDSKVCCISTTGRV